MLGVKFMQLASHEFLVLSDLAMGCYNTITCLRIDIQQAQDPELKQLLQGQFPLHVKDYNLKVEFLQSNTTPDISKFQPAALHPKLENHLQSPVSELPKIEVRSQISQKNDREITTGYLLNQKSSALNYAKGVLECANPDLRTFLENAFLNSSRHAYDIWQYMVKRGYYPLSPAPSQDMQKVAAMFPIANE